MRLARLRFAGALAAIDHEVALTADTTGLTLCCRTSNGGMSNAPGAALKSAHLSLAFLPRPPPGMNTSPTLNLLAELALGHQRISEAQLSNYVDGWAACSPRHCRRSPPS
jgi:hypothetical protein